MRTTVQPPKTIETYARPDLAPIPFNKPCFAGSEREYIAQAVANGHISGDGQFTKKCQAFLENLLEVPKVFLTTSCTDALEMSALLLDIQPGDEVIVPSFTFVSTVNAFVLRGARPVFADIRSDTLNLDERQLEDLITERTKAIVPVHYGGVGCEMDWILEVAARHGTAVIEDNAHGLLGKYNGRSLGTFGCMATQSFHETKNFTCGEGGALLINDPELVERAEIIREKGTNRSRFFRGQVDKYTWVDIGSSFLPSDVLSAFLLAQLERHDEIQRERKATWRLYYTSLQSWAVENAVRVPIVPDHCEQAYHMFYLIMPDLDSRTRFINHLASRGVMAVFHYLPLHLSPMGMHWGQGRSDCPVTEDVSDRLVRLPFFNKMTQEELMRVVEAIEEFKV
jgi:dTDP-4-amino-4,6-dideoxygalactose transaminase